MATASVRVASHLALLTVAVAALCLSRPCGCDSTRPWSDMTSSFNAAGNTPQPRSGHTTGAVGSLVYFLGGAGSAARYGNLKARETPGVPMNAASIEQGTFVVHTYDTQAITWTQVPLRGSVPTARMFHATATAGSTLYTYGGMGVDGQTTFDDCLRLETAASAMEMASCISGPGARYGASFTGVGGERLYLFGGALLGAKATQADVASYLDACSVFQSEAPSSHPYCNHVDTAVYDDLWVFDIAQSTWTRVDSSSGVSGTPPSPRKHHTAVAVGTKIYIFGGTKGKLVGSKYDLPVDAAGVQVHVFDTVTLTWTQPTTTGYDTGSTAMPRRGASAAVISGTLIAVVGGYDIGDVTLYPVYKPTCTNCIDVLDTATNSWASVAVTMSGIADPACGLGVWKMAQYGMAAGADGAELFLWDKPLLADCDLDPSQQLYQASSSRESYKDHAFTPYRMAVTDCPTLDPDTKQCIVDGENIALRELSAVYRIRGLTSLASTLTMDIPGYHHELRALYSKSSPDGYYAMRARTDLDGAVVGNELLIFEGAHHVYSPSAYKVHRYNMDTHTLKDPETTTGTMPPLYRDANTGRSVTVIGTNVYVFGGEHWMMPCNWLCYVCKKFDWLRNGSGSLSITGATGQSSTPMAEWVKFYDKGQFTDESQTATPGIWTPPSCSTEAATFCLNYDGADLDAAAKFDLKPGFDGPLSGLLDDTSVCEADNPTNPSINRLYKFDSLTNTWSQLSPSGTAPAARSYHSAAAVGSKLFVLGGRWAAEEDGDITRIGSNSGEPPSGGVYGDVFYLDTSSTTLEWKQLATTNKAPGSSMAFHSAACAAVGEMIYVAGGNNHFSYGGFGDQRLMEYGGSQDKLHNAVFRLDTSTGDWEVVSGTCNVVTGCSCEGGGTCMHTVQGAAMIAASSTKLYLHGGAAAAGVLPSQMATRNELLEFDIPSLTWSAVAYPTWSSYDPDARRFGDLYRFRHSLAYHKGSLYAVGGLELTHYGFSGSPNVGSSYSDFIMNQQFVKQELNQHSAPTFGLKGIWVLPGPDWAPTPRRLVLNQNYTVYPDAGGLLEAQMLRSNPYDTVSLMPATYLINSTISWQTGISLIGAGKDASSLVCSSRQNSSLAYIASEHAAISNLGIHNCSVNYASQGIDTPAGVEVHSLLANCPKITNVMFKGNYAVGAKGSAIAIKNSACTTELTNVDFVNNSAYNGGALYLEYSSASVKSSTFANNYAATSGGAVYSTMSTLEVDNVSFTNNSALSGSGGAVYLLASQLSMSRSANFTATTFTENLAADGGGGGAISSFLTDLNISDSEFYRNKYSGMPGDGGALLVTGDGGSVIIDNVTATGNSVSSGGGGFLALYGISAASVANSVLHSNHASGFGGGIAIFSGMQLANGQTGGLGVRSTTFRNNSGDYGGAFAERVQDAGSTPLSLVDCVFIDNNATVSGGAVFHLNAKPAITCSSLQVLATDSLAGTCQGSAGNQAGYGAIIGTGAAQIQVPNGNLADQASGASFSPGMGVYLVDKYSQTITAGADAAAKIEVTLASTTGSIVGPSSQLLEAGYVLLDNLGLKGYPGNYQLALATTPAMSDVSILQHTAGVGLRDCILGEYRDSAIDPETCTTCPAGHRSWMDGLVASCTVCPAGTYSLVAKSTACASCPAGFASATEGATSSATCKFCLSNTVAASEGSGACSSCPANAVDIDRKACVCNAGYKYTANPIAALGFECQPCPAGTYASQLNSTTCTPCSAGFASATEGAASSDACIFCLSNTVASSAGSAACKSCPANAADVDRMACACNPGYKYIANPSAPLGFECEACPAGTYSSQSNSTTCTPCLAGFASAAVGAASGDACTACLSNTVASSVGSATCTSCPENAVDINRQGCACKAGYKYSANSSAALGFDCEPCPAGTYSSEPNSTTCIPCPAGFASSAVGAASSSACTACLSNTVSLAEGSATCKSCPANAMDINRQICACNPGYKITENKSATNGLGFECEPCPAGTYSSESNSRSCTPCPAGSASANEGASSSDVCMPCASNTVARSVGSASCASCPENALDVNRQDCACTAGYTAKASATTGLGFECEACPVGHYSDRQNSTGCTPCPASTYNPNLGGSNMDDCLPCDSNTVSDVGAETCRACPTGAFDVNNLECANPDGLPASQTLQMPIQHSGTNMFYRVMSTAADASTVVEDWRQIQPEQSSVQLDYRDAQLYNIEVKRGDEIIPSYQYTHIVTPADADAATSFLGTELTECVRDSECLDWSGSSVSATAGTKLSSTFIVFMRDTFGNDIRPDNTFDVSRLTAISSIASDSQENVLEFRYSSTSATVFFEPMLGTSGEHSIQILLDGNDIENSPFILSVSSAVASVAAGDTEMGVRHAGNSVSTLQSAPVVSGDSLEFTATVKDRFGNLRVTASPEYVTFTVTNKNNGSEVLSIPKTYNILGSAELALAIREASTYELAYKVGDSFASDSPKVFTVNADSAEAQTSVVLSLLSGGSPVACCGSTQSAWAPPIVWPGTATFTACPTWQPQSANCANSDGTSSSLGIVAGTRGSLTLQLLDLNGNHVAGQAEDADGVVVKLTDGSSLDVPVEISLDAATGTYSMSFLTTISGLYTMELSLRGAQLGNSPVGVMVITGPTDASMSFAYVESVNLDGSFSQVKCLADEICGDRITPDAPFVIYLQSADEHGNLRTTETVGDEFSLSLPGTSIPLDARFSHSTGGIYFFAGRNSVVGNKTAVVQFTSSSGNAALNIGNSGFKILFGDKPASISGEFSLEIDPSLDSTLMLEAARQAICLELGDPFWPDQCSLIEVDGAGAARRRSLLASTKISYRVTAPSPDVKLDDAHDKLATVDSARMTQALQTAATDIVTADPTIPEAERMAIANALTQTLRVAELIQPAMQSPALAKVEYSKAALFYNPEGMTPEQLGEVDFETKLWMSPCANTEFVASNLTMGPPRNCMLCLINQLCGPEGGQVAGAPESYTLVLLDEFSNRLTYTPANMVVQYSMLLTGAENPTPKLEGDSSDDVAGSKAVMIGSEWEQLDPSNSWRQGIYTITMKVGETSVWSNEFRIQIVPQDMISLERSTFRVVKDCAVDCITAVTVMEAGVPHQVIIDAMDLYGNKRTTVPGSRLVVVMSMTHGDDQLMDDTSLCIQDGGCRHCGEPSFDAEHTHYVLSPFCHAQAGSFSLRVSLEALPECFESYSPDQLPGCPALHGDFQQLTAMSVVPSSLSSNASLVSKSATDVAAASSPMIIQVNSVLSFYIQLRDKFNNVIPASSDILVFFKIYHGNNDNMTAVDPKQIYVEGDAEAGVYIASFTTTAAMGSSRELLVTHETSSGRTTLGQYDTPFGTFPLPGGVYPLDVQCSDGYMFQQGVGCICQPGYAGSPCRKCGPGLYQPLAGQEDCLACPQSSEPNALSTACVCMSDFFNTNPDLDGEVACDTCPVNGECGENLLVPLPGNWHRHPLSRTITRCLHPDACACAHMPSANAEGVAREEADAVLEHLETNAKAVLATGCQALEGSTCDSIDTCSGIGLINPDMCVLPNEYWPQCFVDRFSNESGCGDDSHDAADGGWWVCGPELRGAVVRAATSAVLVNGVSHETAGDWQCTKGYKGPLCSICEEGYGRAQGFQCSKCPSTQWHNHAKYALMLAIQAASITLTVRSTLKLNTGAQKRARHSEVIKVLVSYMQLTSLAQNLQLEWPEAVQGILATQATVTAPGDEIVSFDCSVSQDHTRFIGLDQDSYNKTYFLKMFFAALLPWIGVAVAAVVWGIIWLLERKKTDELERQIEVIKNPKVMAEYREKFAQVVASPIIQDKESKILSKAMHEDDVSPESPHIKAGNSAGNTFSISASAPSDDGSNGQVTEDDSQSGWLSLEQMQSELKKLQEGRLYEFFGTVVIIEFFIWPKVATNMLTLLSCTTLEVDDPSEPLTFSHNADFLTHSADIKCWSSPHLRALAIVGLPGFIFVVGVPAALSLLLFKYRQSLDERNVKKAMGFLYLGLERKFYFWEVVVMLRKLAIVFIVVFMQSAGTEMQVSCALGVLAIFFVLHINYTPFDDDLLDDMEKYSMLGSMLVYYFGLLIFSGEHLWGSAGRIAISCAILLTNCAVFGYFALTIFLEVIRSQVQTDSADINNDGIVDRHEMVQQIIKKLPLSIVKTWIVCRWLARFEASHWKELKQAPRTVEDIRESAVKIKESLKEQAEAASFLRAVGMCAKLPGYLGKPAAPLLMYAMGAKGSAEEFKEAVCAKRDALNLDREVKKDVKQKAMELRGSRNGQHWSNFSIRTKQPGNRQGLLSSQGGNDEVMQLRMTGNRDDEGGPSGQGGPVAEGVTTKNAQPYFRTEHGTIFYDANPPGYYAEDV